MRFRPSLVVALLWGLASGCTLWRPPHTSEGVVGPLSPPAFPQILIDRESADLSDVVAILVAKGYRVIWDSPQEIGRRYQVPAGQVLLLSCVYRGESKLPPGITVATIACTGADLATGQREYVAQGVAEVHAGTTYVREAVERALGQIPPKDERGYVLSALHLPPRQAAARGGGSNRPSG